MKKYLLPLIIIIIISNLQLAQSQVQRMSILPGKIMINPRCSTRVDSYCCDYEKSSPKGKNSFNHILSSTEQNYVKINSKKVNLQNALKDSIVSVRGINLVETLNDQTYLNSLSFDDREIFDIMREILNGKSLSFPKFIKLCKNPIIWNSLSYDDKILFNQMSKEYDQLPYNKRVVFDNLMQIMLKPGIDAMVEELQNSGDNTGLLFTNNTLQDIEIVINSPGSISLKKCAPTVLSPHVSDAITTSLSFLPITSGLIPLGSRKATNSFLERATQENAPVNKG